MFISADRASQDFTNSLPGPLPRQEELSQSLMWRVLDEIDYGVLLVTPEGRLQHANHLARFELARAKFLKVAGSSKFIVNGQLQANSHLQTAELLRGLRDAARGLRHMLTLRHESQRLMLACAPLTQPFEGACESVLLMLARQSGTANLALSFFARSHKLTNAEEGVLRGLCSGQQIADIAATNGVAESTVRAQIRALREKTQCNNIRSLVQLVATLPPFVPISLSVQAIDK